MSCALLHRRALWILRRLRARQTSVLVPSDSVYLHQNHDQQNQWHEVCDCAANHSRSLTSSLGTPFFGLFRRDQLHLSDAICPCVARLMQPLDRARIACYPFAMSEMTIATPGGCASRKAFGIFHDCVEYPRRPSRCRYGIASWKHLACWVWNGQLH
jgi:hypothetical protein